MGMSNREYYELVDEALVLFGGGAPCCNIDARLWGEFKELFKEFNGFIPKTVDWSFDQATEWVEEYKNKLETQ